MCNSILYFSACFLLLILFFLCSKLFFGGFSFKKILRGVDRALSKSRLRQVFLLTFFIVFTFAFVYTLSVAITSLYIDNYEPSLWNAIGHYFNPGNFEKNAGMPELAIFFINLFGMVLMTGLLISVLSNLLERRVDNIKNGRVSYNYKNHTIILGYDKMTISLVKQLYEKNKDSEIILQTVQKVPKVKHELFSYIDSEIEDKLSILSGNRNSSEDLEKLRINEATELYIIGETNEYGRDSLNIQCLKIINSLLEKNKKTKNEKNSKTKNHEKRNEKKKCYVLFENQSTFAILQQRDIQGLSLVEFLPFNFYEKWAEKVFLCNNDKNSEGNVDNEQNIYLPLDRVPIKENTDHTVHLVILGMSKMGVALGVEATHLCHFPNFINKGLKTRITFIDMDAEREMLFLRGRYQSLFEEIRYSFEDVNAGIYREGNENKGDKNYFTDIEWHFIKGEFEDPAIQNKLEAYSKEENTLLTIAVCMNDSDAAIAVGLYMKSVVYQSDKVKYFKQGKDILESVERLREQKYLSDEDKVELASLEAECHKYNVQILIKQDTPNSIISMLKNVDKYQNVRPFGMLDNCLDIADSDNLDIIAKKVHYVYNYYFGDDTYGQIPTVMPDIEVLDEKWSIPTVEKWSNRYHANMINIKMRSFDFEELELAIENENDETGIIEKIAQVEHNRWNTEKLLMGFRPVTESEKAIDKKILKKNFIHPDIIIYNDLSKSMKDIDRMISKALPLIIKDIK